MGRPESVARRRPARFHRGMPRRFRVVPALVLVAAAGALSYPVWGPGLLARLRTDSIRRMFPTLDPQLARHAVCDDDAQWAIYCRGCGTRPLMDGLVAVLNEALIL